MTTKILTIEVIITKVIIQISIIVIYNYNLTIVISFKDRQNYQINTH